MRKLVIVSMGSAFGAALGAPWAGLIFGFELNRSKIFRPFLLIHSAVAALIAQSLVKLSAVSHFKLPTLSIPTYEIKNFIMVLMIGILFGFTVVFFHSLRHWCESNLKKFSPMLVGLMGGLILTVMFYFFDLESYQGLGRETILQASQQALPISVTLKKILLSIITLGTGFQGGEFFPLAFIGSTLGSAFSFIDPSMTALFASLGFVTTYGAATRTPIACTLLAVEILDWKIFPYAILTLWIATLIHNRVSTPIQD
jgi:H+/Cl- antiporter ClcA